MSLLKIHPLIIHFPMALLVSGALFTLYGAWQGEKGICFAGKTNLQYGFIAGLLAALLGFGGSLFLEIRPHFRSHWNSHVLTATCSLSLFGVAMAIRRYAKFWGARAVEYIVLICALVGILATGFYGGEMVHRFGVGTSHPLN